MTAINFPDPAGQTPINTFGPTTTPEATANGMTYVYANETWKASQANAATYVKRSGDTMDGSLALTDKITLDATAGGASLAGGGFNVGVDGVFTYLAAGLTYDGSNYPTGGQGVFLAGGGKNTQSSFFRRNTNSDGPVITVGNKTSDTILLNADGSASFAGSVFFGANSAIRILGNDDYPQIECSRANKAGIIFGFDNVSALDTTANIANGAIDLGSPGYRWRNAYVTVARAGGVVLELDQDNPDNYTTTTSVETDPETGEETTVETQVYSGPTLDVKEKLLAYEQRFAKQDAVIAELTTRIQALEGGN